MRTLTTLLSLTLILSLARAGSAATEPPFRLAQSGRTYTIRVRDDAPAGDLHLRARQTEWIAYDPACVAAGPTHLICRVQPGQAIAFTASALARDSLWVELIGWGASAFRLPIPQPYPAPAPADPAQEHIEPRLSATWTTDPTRLEVRYAAGESVTVEWLLRPELPLNPPEQVSSFTLCTCAPDAWYKPVPGRVLVLWSSDRRELARAVVPWPHTTVLPLVLVP